MRSEKIMTDLLRSPICYYGGKNMLVRLLHSLVPSGGRPYCEPFCGGASLFFSREPAPVEVLNDINMEIVNLFRVLQNREMFEELRHRLMWTPYARMEFKRALEMPDDASDLDKAWATFVKFNMGFAGQCRTIGNFGRVFISTGGMADTTNRWLMRLSMLDAFHHRLMRVQIDCVDAIQCIRYWDSPDTVFYIDPPYVHSTRKSSNDYKHEMTEDQHRELVNCLIDCAGSVTVSGYSNLIYRALESNGWMRIDHSTACRAAGRIRGSKLRGEGSVRQLAQRVESIWINRKCMDLLTQQGVNLEQYRAVHQPQTSLFTDLECAG